MNGWTPAVVLSGYVGILLATVLIDWRLGATAEYLNAYELVRRTFASSWPEVSRHFLWGDSRLGHTALAVGWLAFLLEAAFAETLLYGAWHLVRSVFSA